jgi:hypothetical protein
MKNVSITNIDNETVTITFNDLDMFKQVIMEDDNWGKCEVYLDQAGWKYLRTEVEEIAGKEIEYNSEDLESYLEDFFRNNLFPEEVTFE